MHNLAKGGNAPVEGATAEVTITSSAPIDVSALLLGPDRKVRSDDDLVFFNHPVQDGVALDGRTVTADLGRVPPDVATIAVVAGVEQPGARFDAAAALNALLTSGGSSVSFDPPPFTGGETVTVLLELYRRGDGWKARAVGQGWASGLAGLATDFGVTVDDPGPATPVPPQAPPASASPPQAPPAAPLGKITLEKAGKATINLDKGDGAAVITATLEWDGGSGSRREMGADLDLYTLFIPAHRTVPYPFADKGVDLDAAEDGEIDEVVYYRRLGSLTCPPFIELAGDAKVPGRETVRITRPDQQGYVLICAYSAVENGAGSFKSYGAHAVVTDGRGSTVAVPLFNENWLSYWVAIALVDFTAPGGAEIRHVERYSSGGEARPVLFPDGTFEMDIGPIEFKDL